MAEEHDTKEARAFHPVGTILILILFLAALVILWGSVYLILLSRGVTL
jgi:hypothetical protein